MLSAEIRARLAANQRGANDFGGPDFTPAIDALLQLTDGVGANQANILWVDERTVASAAADAIDLAGVLSDAFGAQITAVEVVALLIVNKPKAAGAAPNTTALTIGAGSNPVLLNALPAIGPGGLALLADPDAGGLLAVTAGTGDILTVTNGSGAPATYQIAVIARNA